MRSLYERIDGKTISDAAGAVRRRYACRAGTAAGRAAGGQQLYPVLHEAGYRVTVTLCPGAGGTDVVRVEPGDTTDWNYGLCLDIGSTTMQMELVDLLSGKTLAEAACTNSQTQFGANILDRILAVKENPDNLHTLQALTLDDVRQMIERCCAQAGVPPEAVSAMTVGGNTTMLHFFLGCDPWQVFQSPYTPVFFDPGVLRASELGLPIAGNIFCMPAIANYLGGDITSGLLMTDLDTREDLALFLDIGTNGELVLGCREFLLMGAGAAGPALEGAVSRSGMRAEPGAICRIKIGPDNRLRYETVGGLAPKGICGSGILDLIAEGFLSGWIDSAGNLQKSASPCIRDVWDDTRQRNVPAIIYAYDGNVPLYFTQDDIGEFLTCKAAAYTMVATLPRSAARKIQNSRQLLPRRRKTPVAGYGLPSAAGSDPRACDVCAVRGDGKIRREYAGGQIPAAYGRVALPERDAEAAGTRQDFPSGEAGCGAKRSRLMRLRQLYFA